MPFDSQPSLKGKLLELRPLGAPDFDSLFAVASDPLIWEQHPNNDRYLEDQFRMFFREALDSGGCLIAIDKKDGRQVVFLVGPNNVRSQRAVERIGAMRVGLKLDGNGRESMVYQITAVEFSGRTAVARRDRDD